MTSVTDAQIVAALRPLYPLIDERNQVAEVATRLRETTDPDELAERNRNGSRMAELDEEILRRAADSLEGIELDVLSWALRAALEYGRSDSWSASRPVR